MAEDQTAINNNNNNNNKIKKNATAKVVVQLAIRPH